MINGCRNTAWRWWATSRAAASEEPPAAAGTTMRTRRAGQSCAEAGGGVSNAAISTVRVMAARSTAFLRLVFADGANSLPPCGGGSGWGVGESLDHSAPRHDPHPPPLPPRGRGEESAPPCRTGPPIIAPLRSSSLRPQLFPPPAAALPPRLNRYAAQP